MAHNLSATKIELSHWSTGHNTYLWLADKQIYESSFLLVHDCDSLQLRTIALSFNFESSYEFYENIFSSK